METSQAGKWFSSSTHRLLVDRTRFVLEKLSAEQRSNIQIASADATATNNEDTLRIEELPIDRVVIESDNRIAFLDADKLSYPLTWRHWESGDSFYPLGMQHRKKVSDFLVDRKIDRSAKERITVLES